jgi:hypothetical protein
VALLPLTSLALRLVGFRHWQAALACLVPPASTPSLQGRAEDEIRRARVTARLVAAVARRVPCRAQCLQRALTLWWLLRHQGIAGDLRIGVRREASELQGHAWVEYRGIILNDGADVHQRYACFDRSVVDAGVKGG